jgi:tetratricopeptide (TPR) repeat protein
MTIVSSKAAFLALVTLALPLAAQEPHDHGAGGASLGTVSFPTSCNATAQARIGPAVAMLHSFWYERAVLAFRDVVAADSTCAFGYWGQAMSLWHPLWTPPAPTELATGLALADQAVRRSAPGSRARDYAAAIASYYRDYPTVDFKTRMQRYEQAMAGVVERHPEDREARIFYALALIAVGYALPDTTLGRQRRAADILELLFQENPRHPGLAHYLIHAYDFPSLAERGADAAARYAAIAPAVPHARHMPSHIYTRLGEWDRSIGSNVSSVEAARVFEHEQHLNALWDQRGHAMDYLIYAYLQEGKDRDAAALVDTAAGVTAGYPPGSLTNEYALAAIPARYTLERGRWADAARLAVRPAPEWRAAEAITHFARAIGGARSGDTAVARRAVDSLAALEATLAQAGGPQLPWSVQVKIQRLAASAWLAWATGDTAGAVSAATAAADLEDHTDKHPVTPGPVLPARELLGDLLLQVGRPADARRAYEATLARSPNRARSLFGLARAAALAGDTATAREKYLEFLRLLAPADGDRPEIAAARQATRH